MRKFFAVVKREYVQRVRTKFFVVATILGPVMMAAFTIVPALIFGIKAGGPTKLAIVDQTGKMYERVARELTIDRSSQNNPPAQSANQPPQVTANPRERVKQGGCSVAASFLSRKCISMGARSTKCARNWTRASAEKIWMDTSSCHPTCSKMNSLNFLPATPSMFSRRTELKIRLAGRCAPSD